MLIFCRPVFRFYVIGWRFCGLFLRWEILVILVMCLIVCGGLMGCLMFIGFLGVVRF